MCETKKCTKCGEEKELSEYAFRKNRDMYNSQCKICVSIKGKAYREQPEVKQRLELFFKNYHINFPDKVKEAALKNRLKCSKKYTQAHKAKYENDTEYQERKKLRSAKYYLEKAQFVVKTNEYREHSNNLRRNLLKNNPEKRALILEVERKRGRLAIENITDRYIVHQIKSSTLTLNIKTKDIPQELIESKRLVIKLKRLIKQ